MGVGGGRGGSADEAFFHRCWVGPRLVGLSCRWKQRAVRCLLCRLPEVPCRCSLSPACGARLLALFLGRDRNCAGDHLCWLGQTSAPTSRSWEPGYKPRWPQGWELVPCGICQTKSAEAQRNTCSSSPAGGLARTSAAAGHGARLVAMAVPHALSPAVT